MGLLYSKAVMDGNGQWWLISVEIQGQMKIYQRRIRRGVSYTRGVTSGYTSTTQEGQKEQHESTKTTT